MRRLVVFALTLAAGSSVLSVVRKHRAIQLAGEVSRIAAAEKPIPQDAAKAAKHSQDWLEFQRRTLQGAYDKIGRRDPKWDEPAHEALELAARMFSKQAEPQIHLPDVHKPAKAAVDAGCNDPMVVYLCERTAMRSDDSDVAGFLRRARVWSQRLDDSKYPVFRRAIGIKNGANYLRSSEPLTEEIKAEARHGFDRALALLADSVAEDDRGDFWEDQWYDCLIQLIGSYRWVGLDPVAAYERVDAAVAKHPELKAVQLKVRGNFWNYFGWEARTTAFAPFVPAGGFQTFGDYLGKAREALEEAWRLKPDDAEVAGMLMDIDKSVGGDRDTMELWFDRAMKADGDRRNSCWTKLDWLDPKWHGSDAEMLAFGQACRDTKNWRTGITLLCADAHYRYASRLQPNERRDYLNSPAVWSDVEAVYTEYLKHFPQDPIARSKFAAIAFFAEHFAESHAQFEAVGDDLVQWSEFPYVPLAGLKQMRDVSARKAAAGVKPPDPPRAGPKLD